MTVVHNPLEASVHHEALDAAAKLAAHRQGHEDDDDDYGISADLLHHV